MTEVIMIAEVVTGQMAATDSVEMESVGFNLFPLGEDLSGCKAAS